MSKKNKSLMANQDPPSQEVLLNPALAGIESLLK